MVIEPWMWGFPGAPASFRDQYELEQILTTRFGETEKDRLMNLYYSSWMTPRDFANIRSFGFNCIRLPLNYRQFEDDNHPFQLRKDAFTWSDRAIEMAEKEGLYVILDMHGVQGGQNIEDHSGQAGQNKLWTSPEAQSRLCWLWSKIAARYKNRGAVVAYDVFNEPYGGSHELQKPIFSRAYTAIRAEDPEKLIYAMGHYDTFTHYGSNRENGWHNVGYQMHYYPGLFGGGSPTPQTHARHIADLAKVAAQVDTFGSPFLVGEMNVVFARAGGANLMRAYYDIHAKYGWATTMWSYKTCSAAGGLGPDGWGMVVNKNPLPNLDFHTASPMDITKFFAAFATMPLAVNEPLRHAMTTAHPTLPTFPEPEKPIIKAPADEAWPGVVTTDIGQPLAGGLVKLSTTAFDLYGGGEDIWGRKDQFRFLHTSARGDFELEVTITSMADIQGYAKAGLMLRTGVGTDDAFVMLSSFPNAEVQWATRAKTGGDVAGGTALPASFPLHLRLSRRGETVTGAVEQGGVWHDAGSTKFAPVKGSQIGVIALSHDNTQLIKIGYLELKIGKF